MKHHRTAAFVALLKNLPRPIQQIATKNYQLLKQDPKHPSLHFKQLSPLSYWSVRVGIHYQAVATNPEPNVFVWFWIGSHSEADTFIKHLQ